jgi:hypothetical protein
MIDDFICHGHKTTTDPLEQHIFLILSWNGDTNIPDLKSNLTILVSNLAILVSDLALHGNFLGLHGNFLMLHGSHLLAHPGDVLAHQVNLPFLRNKGVWFAWKAISSVMGTRPPLILWNNTFFLFFLGMGTLISLS